ncbi:zinc metallopeptidase [Encephalitozoon intestinalis ATCC 50506]|uniref:Disintegrin and metalloproteinase domain-containing protein B n=1 Tax=Encephalitozoon intestinalis (strain ATCC 50506) TaxID=876142 RepID=E0S7F9_ENCIT|nr:zinc metallopeptidase [Encephalitozoon intestinalis ATCC 50506]ADM11638.1 zinc metallopeptidase [Encephalitozoon intestinalis ATCC 50506]UTX45370.1 metallopeptidase [Encephalitozoon intestinalis]
MLLFSMLSFVFCKTEEISLEFADLSGQMIPMESVPLSSSLIMVFRAFGRDFRLKLADSSLEINGTVMRQNLCDFSIECLDEEECYGSISFCNFIYGSFVSSGVMYRIQSGEDGRVIIKKLGNISMNRQEDSKERKEVKNTKKVIKVFLINDFDRVQEIGPDINLDTIEIFRNAKDIFERNRWSIDGIRLSLNGILNVIDKPLIPKSYVRLRELEMIKTRDIDPEWIEKTDSVGTLRKFSRILRPVKENTRIGMLLEKSNLVLLLQTSSIKVNGLTFVGGMGSITRRFGVVKILESDSYFYKGKVLAHEIAHGLGAEHDLDKGCLMREEEGPLEKEESAVLSNRNIKQIERFILKNKIQFDEIDTCGNGVVEGEKECDSGLPNGSLCCTRQCKLRSGAQCDDRNGRCCKDCSLLPKNTMCKERSSNIHKMNCEEGSYCDGESPICRIKYAQDGSRPVPEGFCKKGVLQTEALMCERVGKFPSTKCSSKDGSLWCLDQYDVCSPVFTSLFSPIKLPDIWSQKANTLAVIRSRSVILLMIVLISLLITSRLIVLRR